MKTSTVASLAINGIATVVLLACLDAGPGPWTKLAAIASILATVATIGLTVATVVEQRKDAKAQQAQANAVSAQQAKLLQLQIDAQKAQLQPQLNPDGSLTAVAKAPSATSAVVGAGLVAVTAAVLLRK